MLRRTHKATAPLSSNMFLTTNPVQVDPGKRYRVGVLCKYQVDDIMMREWSCVHWLTVKLALAHIHTTHSRQKVKLSLASIVGVCSVPHVRTTASSRTARYLGNGLRRVNHDEAYLQHEYRTPTGPSRSGIDSVPVRYWIFHGPVFQRV